MATHVHNKVIHKISVKAFKTDDMFSSLLIIPGAHISVSATDELCSNCYSC
jgi:hypothetical protein